jgi:hypothetical protein
MVDLRSAPNILDKKHVKMLALYLNTYDENYNNGLLPLDNFYDT